MKPKEYKKNIVALIIKTTAIVILVIGFIRSIYYLIEIGSVGSSAIMVIAAEASEFGMKGIFLLAVGEIIEQLFQSNLLTKEKLDLLKTK